MAAVVAMAPLAAAAQQEVSFDDYCTVGSLQFCASVNLFLIPFTTSTGADETAIAVQVQNLEGTVGTTPWSMEGPYFGLTATNLLGMAAFPTATFSGSAGFLVNTNSAGVPDCLFYLGETCPTPSWGEIEVDYGVSSGSFTSPDQLGLGSAAPGLPSEYVGCSAPTVPDGFSFYGYFQTCGDGSVGFSFVLPGTWTFDQSSYLAWGGSDNGNTTAAGDAYCDTRNASTCAQVTPEPTTLVLLGTGLLGIGSVGLRRRRRTMV